MISMMLATLFKKGRDFAIKYMTKNQTIGAPHENFNAKILIPARISRIPKRITIIYFK